MSIIEAENLHAKLQTSLTKLVGLIGKIQIGTKEQFPYGWGNAAKGRTVWRILEEVIIGDFGTLDHPFSDGFDHPLFACITAYV